MPPSKSSAIENVLDARMRKKIGTITLFGYPIYVLSVLKATPATLSIQLKILKVYNSFGK